MKKDDATHYEREDLQEQIPAESTLSAAQFQTLLGLDPVATVIWTPPSESDEREWAQAMQTIPARRSVIAIAPGEEGLAGAAGALADPGFKLHTLDSVAPTEFVQVVDPDTPLPVVEHPEEGERAPGGTGDGGAEARTITGERVRLDTPDTGRRLRLDPDHLEAALRRRGGAQEPPAPSPEQAGTETMALVEPGSATLDLDLDLDLRGAAGGDAPAGGPALPAAEPSDDMAETIAVDRAGLGGAPPAGPAAGEDEDGAVTRPSPRQGGPTPASADGATRMTIQFADIDTAGGGRSTRGRGTRPISPKRASALSLAAANTDFVLRRKIGAGGQGEVWRAWQSSLCREVAVKTLKSGDVTEFLQESYTSGELDHPNIVPVYDLGRVFDGQREVPLLAMKLVRGTPWNDLIARDRKAPDITFEGFLAKHLRILVDVCNAVAYAHSKGIIHRDLKPQQVMVGDYGEVFLMDWGLAISINEEVPIAAREGMPKFRTIHTATNRCGSPAYMAPEQTHESTEKLGVHTDVYLLGAILFELVAGKPPHAAQSAQGAYFMAVVNECNLLPKSTPQELRELIEAALATEPAGRPASATAFRNAIEDYMSGAGRRRESVELTNEVQEEIDLIGEADLGYGELTLLSQKISRALQLWEDNPQARMLRLRLYGLHADRAITAGDLELARTMANWVTEEARKKTLFERIDVEAARQKTAARERRSFLAAAVFCIVLVIVIAIKFQRDQNETIEAANRTLQQRVMESQRLEMLREREGAARAQAELVERLYRLRLAENALAEELRRVLPLPDALEPDEVAVLRLDVARAGELLAAAAALAEDRDRIAADVAAAESQPGGPVFLAPPPPELTTGAANLALARAGTSAEALAAYAMFARAADRHTDSPEVLTGLGIAAWRAGGVTSATLHLAEASRRILLLRGADHPTYAASVDLEKHAAALPPQLARADARRLRLALARLDPEYPDLLAAIPGVAAATPDLAAGVASAAGALPASLGAIDAAEPEQLVRLAAGFERAGSDAEAVRLLARAAARLREVPAGEDRRPLLGLVLLSLGEARIRQGLAHFAAADLREALDLLLPALGAEHRLVATTLVALGEAALEREAHDEALAYFARALAARSAALGEAHPRTAEARLLHAEALLRAGRGGAPEELRRAVADLEAAAGPGHALTLAARERLAEAIAAGSPAEALALRRAVLDARRAASPGDRATLVARLAVAEALLAAGDAAAAANEATAARGELEGLSGSDEPLLGVAEDLVGVARRRLGDERAARAWHAAALARRERLEGRRAPVVALSLLHLADAHGAPGAAPTARLLRRAALAILVGQLGPDTPAAVAPLAALVGALPPSPAPEEAGAAAGLHDALRAALARRIEPLPAAWWRAAWLDGERLAAEQALRREGLPRDVRLAVWRRAAAAADLLGVPADAPLWREALDPLARALALRTEEIARPAPPPGLRAALDAGAPVAPGPFLAYLDEAAGAWRFADLFGRDLRAPDTIEPAGEALWTEVRRVLDAIPAAGAATP